MGSVLHLDGWLAFVHGRSKGGRLSSVRHTIHPGPREGTCSAGEGSAWGRMEIKLV